MEVARRGGSAAATRALIDSVAADTPPFVHLAARAGVLTIRVDARSAASARATLDDLFACLAAAERTLPDDRPAGAPSPTGRPAARRTSR